MPTEDLAAREAYLKSYRGTSSNGSDALDSEDVQERMKYLTRKRKLESVSGFKSYKMPDWKEIGAMGDDPSAINIGKQKRLFDEAEVGDEIYDPYSGYTAIKVSPTEYSIPEYDQEQDKAKPVEAFVHSAAREIPAVAGGVAAMGAVEPAAVALSKMGRGGQVAGAGLTLGAGLVGTVATGMGFDALLPEDARKQLEKERRDQPVASTAGGLAASAPFFGTGKGADTIRRELLNRAAPAAIGTGLGVANEAAAAGTIDPSEFQEGAGERIALMGAQNAIFNTNTKLGDQIMGLGKKTTTSIVALADQAASAPTATASNAEANKIALGQPIDNYKPGRTEELGGLEGFTPKENMEFGSQADITTLGLEKTAPTKKATPIQTRIESELGIGRPNHVDVLNATQAADEAERIVARLAMGEVGDTGVRPGETGRFGSGEEAKGDFFPVPAVKTDAPTLAAKDTLLAKILETNEAGAQRAVTEGPTRGPVMEDIIGERAVYEGYEGTVIKDKEGTYAILRDVTKPGEPKVVEIAGAGKNPSQLAAELGVELPPTLPKPSPRVEVIPLGKKHLVVEGVGKPVEQFQVKAAGEERGRTLTREQMKAEGIEIPKVKGVSQAGERGSILVPGDVKLGKNEQYVVWWEGPSGRQIATKTDNLERAKAIYEQFRNGDWAPEGRSADRFTAGISKAKEDIYNHQGVIHNRGFGGYKDYATMGKPFPEMKSGMADQSAFIDPALMFQMAKGSATVAASLIGYQYGDTPEEKKLNAALAAMIVGGGLYGRNALKLLKKRSPAAAKAVVDVHGEPLTAKENEPPLLETDAPAWKPFLSKLNVVGPALKQATIVFDNIYAVAPQIAGKMRDMIWRELSIGADLHNKAMPALKALRSATSKEGFDKIGRLLMSGKEQEAFDILENTPGFAGILYDLKEGWPQVRDAAYEAWKRARPNEDFGQLEGYWPRVVADSKKLKEILGQEESDIITDLLAKALGAKRKKTGNYDAKLTPQEEGEALAALLQGNLQFPGKPSHLKPRTLKEIEDNWNQIFEPVDVALDKYIGRISRDIAVNEFLGRVDDTAKDPWTDLDTTEKSPVGALLAEGLRNKSIKQNGREVIIKNINAYLNQPKGEAWQFALQQGIGTFRTATNLAQIGTAMTQLQDIFLTAAINSPTSGLKGFATAVGGRLPGVNARSWKVGDVNISEMNPEIADFARNRGFLEKAVHFALKPFFKVADRLGRETFLNSTAMWATEQARLANPSAKFKGAAKAYEAMFGKEEWKETLSMMKEADWMDPRLKKFLFNHISGYQPTSKLEMPVGMLEATPLGKIPWGLMTFALRQTGAIRRQVYEELKAGNVKEAALFMSAYALWVGVGNSMVQYAKDSMSGKQSEPSDYPFGVILNMLALNKVTTGQMIEGNYAEAVGERMLPGVYRPLKAVAHDIGVVRDIAKGKQRFLGKPVLDTPQFVPWGGKMYYDRFGRGAEISRKNDRSRKPKPTTLDKLSEMINGKERRSR